MMVMNRLPEIRSLTIICTYNSLRFFFLSLFDEGFFFLWHAKNRIKRSNVNINAITNATFD